MELQLTKNRKTSFKKNHANTFGLMYGNGAGGTCPGATDGPGGCLSVREGRTRPTCYMAKITAIYPAVANVLNKNTEMLQNADFDGKVEILRNTIKTFRKKSSDALYFRLHYSGDFFSEEYAKAWALVIRENPDIKFWTYTRSPKEIIHPLVGIKNLTLYLSIDPVNEQRAIAYYESIKDDNPNVGLAWMDHNSAPKDKYRFVECPETTGKISNGDIGACAKCRLCIDNFKTTVRNITFKIH